MTAASKSSSGNSSTWSSQCWLSIFIHSVVFLFLGIWMIFFVPWIFLTLCYMSLYLINLHCWAGNPSVTVEQRGGWVSSSASFWVPKSPRSGKVEDWLIPCCCCRWGRRLSYLNPLALLTSWHGAMGQGEWKGQVGPPTTISVSLMMLVVEAQLLTAPRWHSLVGDPNFHQTGNGRPFPCSAGPTIPAGGLEPHLVLLGRNERLSVYLAPTAGGIRVLPASVQWRRCMGVCRSVPGSALQKPHLWVDKVFFIGL